MLSFNIYVFVCAVIIYTVTGNPYCDIKCKAEEHTMCKFTVKSATCTGMTDRRLSGADKDDLLKQHNEFRSRVATGKLSHLPKASDMKKMYWDEELATIAQRWADQCTFAHDKCRSLLTDEPVGQNIKIWMSNSNARHPFDLKGWKDEAQYATKDLIVNFGHTEKIVGHFTQMVWAESDRVGCALSVYLDDKSKTNELIVCNYAPTGNWNNRPVYTIGEPRDKICARSKTFSGLCVREGDPDSAGVTAGGVLILVTSQLILLFA